MALKPTEIPVMNDEQRKALESAVIAIDSTIIANAGQEVHCIGIDRLGHTSGRYRDWFYYELVRQYKEAGWKYVTVSYYNYSSSGGVGLHLSQTDRVITRLGKSIVGVRKGELDPTYLAGDRQSAWWWSSVRDWVWS